MQKLIYIYNHSAPQIRPPFCNLSLSTKHRRGLYTGCDIFSHNYALPSGAIKHDLIVTAEYMNSAHFK